MSDIYVIYWSGTGNTEMMAGAVAEGIHAAGGHANVLDVASASADVLKDAKAFALGCPAMGSEQLEEGDMEPFVEEVEKFAAGKTIGLFGSYDWGDGEWMRTWCGRAKDAGAELVEDEGLIVNNTPDDEGLAACRELGGKLA